jgi:hypothetical protein
MDFGLHLRDTALNAKVVLLKTVKLMKIALKELSVVNPKQKMDVTLKTRSVSHIQELVTDVVDS